MASTSSNRARPSGGPTLATAPPRPYNPALAGEVSERLKEPVSKTGEHAGADQVQPTKEQSLTADGEQAGQNVLALRLALLVQKDPDLAKLIDAWADLPEALKTGIMAMIQGASR